MTTKPNKPSMNWLWQTWTSLWQICNLYQTKARWNPCHSTFQPPKPRWETNFQCLCNWLANSCERLWYHQWTPYDTWRNCAACPPWPGKGEMPWWRQCTHPWESCQHYETSQDSLKVIGGYDRRPRYKRGPDSKGKQTPLEKALSTYKGPKKCQRSVLCMYMYWLIK